MAVELLLVKRDGVLHAENAMAADDLAELPEGKTLKASITQPRQAWRHRKFFALLDAIYPHQTVYPTKMMLRHALHCAVGYGDTVKFPDGRILMSARSIAWHKMDETEFKEVYERMVYIILDRILPGVDKEDLEERVLDILKGRK